ncbi:MAG: PhzF family phenazine biosynthesis protein [Chloroflexota bacterium]|nr:PhzF family phenazine biosynthesis protein [Chloroflexota bacterium]
MPRYQYLQVDAFTNTPLTGNACLVVLDADDMPADTMQALARETNLSETAFLLRSDRADFRARYFTPAEEIPLAGHPTLAVTRTLIDSGRLDLAHKRTFTLELKAGVITVEIDDRENITMAQRPPVFMNTYDAAAVLPVFGLRADDALPGVPLQTVSTGTPQLMIPIRRLERLREAVMDMRAYLTLKAQGDFFSPHLFCLEGISADAKTFARHFGSSPDTYEDPFTGSATGGMGAYLWRYGLIAQPRFIAEQGHGMQRPGRAMVEVVGAPDAMTTVKVGGAAVTVMRGEILL